LLVKKSPNSLADPTKNKTATQLEKQQLKQKQPTKKTGL